MPIIRNNHPLVTRYKGGRAAIAVYKGLHLVWIAIRSCFGSGAWIGERPWIGDDAWKGTT